MISFKRSAFPLMQLVELHCQKARTLNANQPEPDLRILAGVKKYALSNSCEFQNVQDGYFEEGYNPQCNPGSNEIRRIDCA